ncbi:MAG: NADP-dependent isocitrate dehydrogenase [Verrucomicrobiota bacterium]
MIENTYKAQPAATTTPRVKHTITAIPGDGIGPEITSATQKIIQAAGLEIEWETVEAGKKVFEAGLASGVSKECLQSIRKNKVALKGPLETPIGYGGKSANVTLRKMFETFGNIRPVREIPGIHTPFSGRGIDLVVVRENVEDLYAGIEHMQTPDVAQCLKLISTKGCYKISELAFEIASAEKRSSVHVATKANIMKKTEGMMKQTFETVSKSYPKIQAKHLLIDNCAHQLVINPEQFEVIMTTNMNGDIISDLTSGLVGGLGIAPSANIGHEYAIFEAVHGSAPDIAGKDIANPTAMIQSAVMMLRHLGEFQVATQIEQALFVTLQSGQGYPVDIAAGRPVVGTRQFTDMVVANLGTQSALSKPRTYDKVKVPQRESVTVINKPKTRKVVGTDIFIEFDGTPEVLGDLIEDAAEGTDFKLKMISNRGTMVYPANGVDTDCVDHWRCRMTLNPELTGKDIDDNSLWQLLNRISQNGLCWMHIEKLNQFDGENAYTKAQGEA